MLKNKANIMRGTIIKMTRIAKPLVTLVHELKFLLILKGKKCVEPITNL